MVERGYPRVPDSSGKCRHPAAELDDACRRRRIGDLCRRPRLVLCGPSSLRRHSANRIHHHRPGGDSPNRATGAERFVDARRSADRIHRHRPGNDPGSGPADDLVLDVGEPVDRITTRAGDDSREQSADDHPVDNREQSADDHPVDNCEQSADDHLVDNLDPTERIDRQPGDGRREGSADDLVLDDADPRDAGRDAGAGDELFRAGPERPRNRDDRSARSDEH
jgi:hypothetical protein